MRNTRRFFRLGTPTTAAWLSAALLTLAPAAARAQSNTPREETWETNGPVYAIARAPAAVYIGGAFTYVGPHTGGGVPISATTGQPLASFPKVNQEGLMACAPDGSGGWYIGGFFTRVGGLARNNIAHILSDGSVDSTWDPNATGDYPSFVMALAVSGSTLYAGGNFTRIGGRARHRIAALDAATGAATDWNPNADSYISALVVSGSTVYACGPFTTIGGQARNCLAALDIATGTATPWAPCPAGGYIPWPVALAVSNSTVYIGGGFTSIGAHPRNGIAAIDAATGEVTAWNPNPAGSGSGTPLVDALAVEGSTVYAGGLFTSIGGQARNYIAALDVATGLATDWDPNAEGAVITLAASGSTVYVGGRFSNIGGQPRYCLAALDAATGAVTDWDPKANGEVNVLAVSAAVVYAGGWFDSVGGLIRNHIAALDAGTGAATDWDPNADYWVNVLAVSGPTVYAGGEFANIGRKRRDYIAALDAATGAATDWDPDAQSFVEALALSGSTVYAGGRFDRIGGATRHAIAALDAVTGTATNWNPNASGGSSFGPRVRALAVVNATVYAGGDFSGIGGRTRNCIAALDAATGAATGWDPSADQPVLALAASGSMVFAGGDFTHIAGKTRNYIAALDAATGAAAAWNPNAGARVNTVAASGSTVYAGGRFTTIGGQTRNYIAALDAVSADAIDWDPNASQLVHALAISGSKVYVGGEFAGIGGQSRHYFAQFDTLPLLTVQSRNPDSGVTIGLTPLDTDDKGDGTTPFTRNYQPETTVTLTAPAEASGNSFIHWLKDDSLFTTSPTVTVIADVDHTMKAVYQEQEIEVRWKDNEHVIADGDTTPSLTAGTDFGSVLVTTGTTVRTFTIANVGTVDLVLTGSPMVALSGPDASDFSIAQQPTSPVAPGGSTSFQVIFDPNPGPIGARKATLSIANDDFDENPYDFAIQGTVGAPRLLDVADAGAGSALLSWDDGSLDPWLHLGLAWDVYSEDWARTNPADPVTMWRAFPPEATSGTMRLGWSGGYHVWISSLYADGSWYPCPNPWTGVLYSGTPHTPADISVFDIGGAKARLHWKPEIYGTWHYQIIVFHVTSVDPPAGEWIAVDGPAGMALWHFIDYGGLAYNSSKAGFLFGYADFTLPGPGAYWFYIRAAGWLPPYDPPTTGEFAAAFAQIGP